MKQRRSRGAAPKASEIAPMRRALADASRRHSGAFLCRMRSDRPSGCASADGRSWPELAERTVRIGYALVQ